MCASGHFYLVVFWMKTNKIEIIDNTKPQKGMDELEKYGFDIGILKDMFEAYFIEKNMTQFAKNIKKSQYGIIPLEWFTSTNKKDCGVFLMRHMETYFGKKGRDWDIGFSARSIKIIQILRGRYCETMLASKFNKENMKIVGLATDWMQANKDRLPELNAKYKQLFAQRNKK